MKQHLIHRFLSTSLVVGLFLGASSAAHADYYAKPTLANLIKTMIRYDAIDFNDNRILDIYIRGQDCGIYARFFNDEFTWEKLRRDVRRDLKEKIPFFPVAYTYEAPLQLERYDFVKRLYPFYMKKGEFDVNTFTVDASNDISCIDKGEKYIPLRFKFVLKENLKMLGLDISEAEGQALFERMEAVGNDQHIIYPRFNVRVVHIPKLATKKVIQEEIKKNTWGGKMLGDVGMFQPAEGREVFFGCVLDSVEYYEDEKRTKLIYTYWP